MTILRGIAMRVLTAAPRLQQRRSFHEARAQFTTIDRQGLPVSSETEIRIGDAGEAYIYVAPNIGKAIQDAVARQVGLTVDTEKAAGATLPMQFHHPLRAFTHSDLPIPRVEIDHDLPKQRTSTGDISCATLWTSGNWHAITLDGSDDEKFERASRETGTDLQGALSQLKHH